MNPRYVLAITDFSAFGDHALSRAAHLCAAHGAALKLVHFNGRRDSWPLDAPTRLSQHAAQLKQRHGIHVSPFSRTPETADDLLAAARQADLLVWGTAPLAGLRVLFEGQPYETLMRRSRRPVLVVRHPARESYRKVLVAVDFSASSRRLVELSLALNESADVELFHAISAANEGKLRHAEVSEQAIRDYRQACRRYAQDRMFWLTDSYDARRNRVMGGIGHGDPARQAVVQQQRSAAQLIVVGKRPSSALTDFVFGSVARRVLRLGAADVLVVPHDVEPASGADALARLAAEQQPVVRRVRAGALRPPGRPDPAALRARL